MLIKASITFKNCKQGITYSGEGRSIIDSAFLKGHWTVIGFVENARLAAEECAK